MADTLSNIAILDNLVATYFVRKALPRLVARAVLYEYGVKEPLPKGGGNIVRWNAWSNFDAVSTTLTEGTNPSLAGLSSRKVQATIAQYGRGVKTTDLVEYTSSLDLVQGVIDNLGDSAGISVDKVIQLAIFKNTLAQNEGTKILSVWMSAVASAFHAGSNGTYSTKAWGYPVVFGMGTANRLSAVDKTAPSVSARLSLYSIKKTVKKLRSFNAMEFADGFFKLVTNSDAIADLRTDPDFKNWLQNTTSTPMQKGDATVPVEGCRIIQSNILPKYRATGHSADVSFIFGQGAYGVVEIGAGKGKGFQIITKRPGPNDTSNPLDMFSTISYKFSMVAAALNVSSGRVLITHAKP